jgi:hypothetical protein
MARWCTSTIGGGPPLPRPSTSTRTAVFWFLTSWAKGVESRLDSVTMLAAPPAASACSTLSVVGGTGLL